MHRRLAWDDVSLACHHLPRTCMQYIRGKHSHFCLSKSEERDVKGVCGGGGSHLV
jgi:hypothetical protein